MFTDALKRFQEGVELHKLGFLQEAAYKYTSLLNSDKYKALANFNLASIRFKQYRYYEAIQHYVDGLNLVPDNFYAHVDLAKAYEMVGQWDRATDHLDLALEISPNYSTALRRKIRILEEKQFYESLRIRLESEMTSYGSQVARVKNEFLTPRHIDMQADYQIDRSVYKLIETLMKRVYLELNEELGFQPEEPVKITLLYDKALYAADSMSSFPKWAVGMYDGSIKILLRQTDKIHLGLSYVLLRHEYMHKIVDELSNGKCPRWFNEGLAEYKARKMFDFERDILRKAIAKEQHFSLDELEDKFITQKNNMRLAYLQACSIVELTVEKLGLSGVCGLLNKIGSNERFGNEGFHKVLRIALTSMSTLN